MFYIRKCLISAKADLKLEAVTQTKHAGKTRQVLTQTGPRAQQRPFILECSCILQILETTATRVGFEGDNAAQDT